MSISPSSGQLLAVGPHARPVRDLARVPGRRGQPHPRFDETMREAEFTLRAHQAGGIDGITDAAILALPDQRQVKRPAAFGDLSGVVAVNFLGVDRGGDTRAVPSGRPFGRVQAGAVELIVERQLPVAADTGRIGVRGACFRGSGRCLGIGFGMTAAMTGGGTYLYIGGVLLTRTAARPARLADARWKTPTTVAAPSSMTPTRRRPVMTAAVERDRRLRCLRRGRSPRGGLGAAMRAMHRLWSDPEPGTP